VGGGERAKSEVKAGGGVVVRDGAAGIEIAVVHRPRYDDWSLPKGKLEPGESFEAGALREVEEETGLRCELGDELSPISYHDRKGRLKLVRYWMMRPVEGDFAPNEEVDVLEWLPPAEAAARLDYEHDRKLLTELPLTGEL
jgi:8-oxo-dGTP diphosphatase